MIGSEGIVGGTPLRVDLIGVPFNSGGRADGVARAPSVLRRAGLMAALGEVGVDARDRGDVRWEAATDEGRDPVSGVIAPAALASMIVAVRREVASALTEGGMPLILGGDCPVLLGCLGAVAGGASGPAAGGASGSAAPGLLFIDGHEDAWPPGRSPTGEAADMELGFLLGLTLDGLPAGLVREIPVLAADRLVVIGPRDAAELEAAAIASIQEVVPIVRPAAVANAPAGVTAAAVEKLSRAGRWWLHVDLDVLSSASLAAVDYPQPGGLDWDDLTHVVQGAVAAPGLIGWVVTIYNPDLDPDAAGARRIVRFMADCLGALIDRRNARTRTPESGRLRP